MSYHADLQILISTAKIVRSAAKHLLDESVGSLTEDQTLFAQLIEQSAVKILELNSERLDSLKLIQAASKEFAETVHQLRSSLSVIINCQTLFEELYVGLINERECYQLMKIQRATNLAQTSIIRLLSIDSRPERPLLVVRRFFDLNDILKKAMENFAWAVEGKPIELQLKVDDNLPNAFGDARYTSRILSNLLHNAAKFTNSGTISITVQTVPIREGHPRLQIAIADTGIGMSPEMCLAANNSRWMPAPDLGIGLLLVSRFTQLQGGKFRLESQAGEGTVAYVQLLTKEEGPRCTSLFNMPRRLFRSHSKRFEVN
jgi:signal transduction histidine kinase